ncbi:MAG: GNAT family N-acetyltransferase [Actinobacteria bacterium]|nr:MAG: GNAT family N-acetyltransferase [Actinomycetota bacterium]
MVDGDVDACELVWDDAITDVRTRFGLPVIERTPELVERMRSRVRHLLATDPDGSFVATRDGDVVGVAQALVRDDVWVLSLLGVAPPVQAQGIGRRLLEAALSYAGGRRGMILSSRDPKAMRRYALAGFDLHPAVTAWGRVVHDRLPATPGVREGSAGDLDLVAEVDRHVRGAARGLDIAHLLEEAGRLLVVDGVGYVVVRDEGRPVLLAARDDGAATALLFAALAGAPRDRETEVGWITADQQWAIRASLVAGLELHPVGPVMLRGFARPPAPYLPSGAFG